MTRVSSVFTCEISKHQTVCSASLQYHYQFNIFVSINLDNKDYMFVLIYDKNDA